MHHITLVGVKQWACGWGESEYRPLCGGVRAVEGVFKLNDGAVLVLQNAVLRRVVLHQLWQGGKLLPSIQVVIVSRVLDADVGHCLAHPEKKQQSGHRN